MSRIVIVILIYHRHNPIDFFLIPFYLQAVHVHSANGGTLRKA
jgi:hypothetical protein